MNRQILVLARRDSLEAMRVAAGLTIFGHQVTLVLMGEELSPEAYQSEQVELLELAEIEPLTTVSAMGEQFCHVSPQQLGQQIIKSDAVLNL